MNNKCNVKDIEFNAEGTILRGWLYTPADQNNKVPAIVMAHGFAAIKEMYLDKYAEIFASSGYAVLVFDQRNFGDSDGEPRQEIDPVTQVRDYRHAITFVQTQEIVDPTRIGVWGTSYSGGHVLVVAAIDRRVKCVVFQVPAISGWKSVSFRSKPEELLKLRQEFDQDRSNRFNGLPPAIIPIVAANGRAAFTHPAAFGFFTGKDAPAADQWRYAQWKNEITLRSLEMMTENEPGSYIEHISPTPLLMLLAEGEELISRDIHLEAFNRAGEPKKLHLVSGGHFAAYFNVAEYAQEGLLWFKEHLQ